MGRVARLFNSDVRRCRRLIRDLAGVLLFAGAALWAAWEARRSIRSGTYRGRGREFTRTKTPVNFWFIVVTLIVASVGVATAAVFRAIELFKVMQIH